MEQLKKISLKKRIITAVILAPLLIICIFVLSKTQFSILTAIILLIGSWEWSRLMGYAAIGSQAFYSLLVLVSFLLTKLIAPEIIFLLAAIWWLLAFYFVMTYPASSKLWARGWGTRALMGILVLTPCWLSINIIRDHISGISYLLLALFIVWSVDVGAFIVGKLWGKHKLAPQVSPGKTIAGLFGGIGLAIIVAFIGGLWLEISWYQLPLFILLTIIVALAAVVGDLFESMIKRQAKVKDSGNLLPGHGGLLDRIDSWTAALPIFALGMLWFGF